jgi:hypothetical protein
MLFMWALPLPLFPNPWSVLCCTSIQPSVIGCCSLTDFANLQLKLLKNGGRMLIPVGTTEQALWQVLVPVVVQLVRDAAPDLPVRQISKSADGAISEKRLLGVRYVPLVKPRGFASSASSASSSDAGPAKPACKSAAGSEAPPGVDAGAAVSGSVTEHKVHH